MLKRTIQIVVVAVLVFMFFKHIDARFFPTTFAEDRKIKALNNKDFALKQFASVTSMPMTVSHGKSSTESELSTHAIKNLSVEEKVYCLLLKSNLNLNLKNISKLWAYAYQVDEDGDSGFTVMIQSSDCPNGLFSKVRLRADNSIKEFLDCRSTTREELVTHAGIQGNIREVTGQENTINLAISGAGMFIEDCGKEVYYRRDGRFFISMDGDVITERGCLIIDSNGQPLDVRFSKNFDEKGCSDSGECIAIAMPQREDILYKNSKTILAINNPLDRLISSSSIFENAYEDIENSEGSILGPNFNRLPLFKKPFSCP